MGRAARTRRRAKKGLPTTASSASATNGGGGGEWADLPRDLLLSVLDSLPSIVDLLAVAAVCRSWRAAIVDRGPASAVSSRHPLFLDPLKSRILSPADPAASYPCLVPRSIVLRCPFLGYSHGRLIFHRGRCPLLADFASGDVLEAPQLPLDYSIRRGILTAPLSAPECDLVLLLSSGRVLLRWRVGGERGWSEHPLDQMGTTAALDGMMMPFRGQIFALDRSCCRLFVVNFSSNNINCSIRDLAVRWPRGESLLPEGEGEGEGDHPPPFIAVLVECGGELMLVRFGPSISEVHVFRLDFSSPPSWVKMESIGEAALFVDVKHGTSASCSNPSRWGLSSDCIYVVWSPPVWGQWYVSRLDRKKVSYWREPGLYSRSDPNDPRLTSWPQRPSPIWVYPSILC